MGILSEGSLERKKEKKKKKKTGGKQKKKRSATGERWEINGGQGPGQEGSDAAPRRSPPTPVHSIPRACSIPSCEKKREREKK